jgi:SAM-dependent methyltransferase
VLDRDIEYLRKVQYRDSSNLQTRANLHVAYRTAPVSVLEFLAGLVPWSVIECALDVGCGPGWFWESAAPAIRLTLSDLSIGMVEEAGDRARGAGIDVAATQTCDAQSLPFEDASFDLVTAFFVLYHLPDPAAGVDELARVVRADGTVLIATNGPGHLAEIADAREAVFGNPGNYEINESFSPARAAALLVDRFDQVRWYRYDDTLRVTSAADVVAFALSSPPGDTASEDEVAALADLVEQRMAEQNGVFSVSKHTGAFVCCGPRRTINQDINM